MEDNACYCPEEYISTFWRTKGSSVPHDILEFQHSFGYDVKRLFNLVLIDPDVLVFASGNILHFYRISTKEITFRRSADGGGIGFITKNPNPTYNYLTVAENGDNPRVLIYKFPEMEVISELENAAQKSFTCVSYRPDGEVLATQAGEPDYMLTIWNWKSSSIILRSKSFQNDVLNVVFSPYNPSLLTTCGLGHIKFWKMSRTFTGLKLQGDIGRFGKTEFSDIYAIYPLADEKVISGCSWGNLLLWDAGLIKLEVCRKNRKHCHDGPITYIGIDEGEVMTVGMDGYVRIWFWETVEIADPPDDDRFVEIEPINEFRIGPKLGTASELRQLIRIEPNDPKDYTYYAQDGNGGIWICDLNVESTPEPPKKIFQCHAGRVQAIDVSPISTHFASLGCGGALHLYNYLTPELLFVKIFPAAGSDLVWLPCSIDASGSVIILGFDDGVIRQVVMNTNTNHSDQNCYLINAIKSHSSPITKLSINPNESILVSGSEDKTIFIHQLARTTNSYVKIIPIGFLKLSSIPNSFNWRPDRFSTILIGGFTGEVFESDLPEQPRGYTEISYNLEHIEIKKFQFKSIKSQIRRNIYLEMRERQKQEKRNSKMEEIRKLREANPGIEIDEDIYLADSDSEEELEPLYIPKIPNPILWLRYTPEHTIWLSIGGYDAGYIYECNIDRNVTTTTNTLIAGADDIEIHSFLQYGQFLIFGMQDGRIRINAINSENFRDLSDYWILSMHDNFNGIISKICTSYDGRHVFTIGYDNNIFSYKWNGPVERKPHVQILTPPQPPTVVADIDDITFLSLEEQKIKNERDRRLKLSNERKQKVLDIIAEYKAKFKDILRRNKAMPQSQQLTSQDLELDVRITDDLTETLDEELQLVRRKLSYQVEKSTLARQKVMQYFIDPLENLSFEVSGIRANISAKTFRIRRLDQDFYDAIEEVDRVIRERTESQKSGEITQVLQSSSETEPLAAEVYQSFLLGIGAIKLNPRMKRLLERYRERQTQITSRNRDWLILNSQKPDHTRHHPDDIELIEEAERTIGDYKLKTSPEYIPPETENTPLKYKGLLKLREQLFHLRNDYNKKVLKLRIDKENLYQFVAENTKKLEFIHEQVPVSQRKFILPLPEINEMKEYPEKNLEPIVQISNVKEVTDLMFSKPDPTAVLSPPSIVNEILGSVDERLEWQILSLGGISEIPDILQICNSMEENPKLPDANRHQWEEFASQSSQNVWEVELRYRRIIDKLIEQDQIIQEVNDRIDRYDKEMEELVKIRLKIDIDGKFLEERIMSINQELFVLRDCEQLERLILKEVDTALRSKNQFHNIIVSMKVSIDDNKRNIDKMLEQVKSIQNNFMTQIKGNKFFEFLRRIFKKKYKPPKESHPDQDSDESTESDTSTSEEEDEGSDDSLDLAPIRFDENFCPPGCEKRLYDLAFVFRSERHILEQNIHQNQKTMEDRKKEIEDMKVRLKDAEEVHVQKKRKLLDFMRERQKVLNKIKTLVVLRMDQLQYVKEGTDIRDTRNTLLFNADYVVKLYIRVGQLGQETLDAKRKHKVNIIHLQRMEADCKYMDRKILKLQTDVQEAMVRKFGMVVDLDELEEAVLRKFIYETKTCLEEEKKEFERQMAIRRRQLNETTEILIKQTQIGTEKLNILTVLQEEKNFLSELLQCQARLYDKEEKSQYIDFRKDNNKLKDILLRQEEQIELIEKEIRTLRLRAKPLQQPKSELESQELYEILPHQNLYEDIVYETVTEAQLPTRGINPDTANGKKIIKIVKRFLVKTVGQYMSEEIIRKYTTKISDYLGFVAHNFECDQAEKVVECVVENFQAMVPHKYLLYIKPHDIKDLFNEVIEIFDYEKAPINTQDVLNGIISNSLDICSSIKTKNYTQEIVTEVFREIIEVLSMKEIGNPTSVELIYKSLRCIPEINPKCINIEQLMEILVDHARENLLDEFNHRIVRQVAEQLIESLISFKGRGIKPEKPME